MRPVIIVILFTFSSFLTLAQAPALQWQKSIGGTGSDGGVCIQPTADGGYITIGTTESDDSLVPGNHGGQDIWVVKLDDTAAVQWQKCLGGSGYDDGRYIQPTADGGYICIGITTSNDSEVTGNHGLFDCWVVKLDDTGGIQWQKCYGTSGNDFASSIKPAYGGGYIFTGMVKNADGDVTSVHGGNDCWVVRIDDAGNILWQKTYGGSNDEEATDIELTPDGGYVFCGYSYSSDGDVTTNYGFGDVWIVKIDTAGTLLWQKSMGGSGLETASMIQPTSDGGYITVATTSSTDHDVTGFLGEEDIWVVKMSDTGALQWQKCLGGSQIDAGVCVRQTNDGGYIVAGDVLSSDYYVHGFNGISDYWAVKLNHTGGVVWQKCLGGSGADVPAWILQTPDSGYVLVGGSQSDDSDVTGNHGSDDMWVVKLATDTVAIPTGIISVPNNTIINVFPNPAEDIIRISSAPSLPATVNELTDIMGKVVIQKTSGTSLSLSALPQGVYLLNVYDVYGARLKTEKIVKE